MQTIWLSATGCDSTGDGSRKRPVATLARAVELTRAAGAGKRRIAVETGVYADTSATLEAADSGLEITAAEGAAPVFHGGTPVTGWRRESRTSKFWIAPLPGVREGTRDFRALVVNDRFAQRARFPEHGGILHASTFPVRWMSTTKGGWERKPTHRELTTLRLVKGSLPSRLSIRNAELTIFHSWDESLVGIRSWDRAKGLITFSTPAGHPPGAFGDGKTQARTFAVWNVREGMTRPGQWYLDRERGCVVYWPLKGESLRQVTACAPTRTSVIRIAGSAEAPVRGVRLRGLTLGVTTTPLVAGGFGALKFEGALEATHAPGLRLDHLTVRWAGGQGVRVTASDGVHCNGLTVCEVGGCGAVFAGRRGVVSGALIRHNGRIYPSALGLRVGGDHWRIHHNTLHHCPYSAINAHGTGLSIEHNRFHHVMEELVDGAAIYVSSGKRCILRGNYTHDLRPEQVHAYYLDEQCADSLVEGNVAVGVPWPIHNHMAWRCVLRDNVCLHDGDMRLSFVACDRFRLARNVFACAGELIVHGSYTGVARLEANVFHSGAGCCRWAFHDLLPSRETNARPVALLPVNAGSVTADPGCRCDGGRVSYANRALARRLQLPALDVSGAGCG